MAESNMLFRDKDMGKECYICKIFFDRKERRPKILPCGHNVCAPCINSLVDSHIKSCPFCRQVFDCIDASDFATNMDAIRYLKTENLSKKSGEKVDDASSAKGGQCLETFQSIKTRNKEMCREALAWYSNADLLITKEIRSNIEFSVKLNNSNELIDILIDSLEKLEKRNNTKVDYLEQEITHLKVAQLRKIEFVKRFKDLEARIESTDNLILLHKTIRELKTTESLSYSFTDDLKKIILDLEETRRALEEAHQKCKEKIDKIEAIFGVEETEGEPKSACSDRSAANCDEEKKEDLESTCLDHPCEFVTVDDIREMKEPVKILIMEGKVFAMQIHDDKHLFGHLGFSDDGDLQLHHMASKESLPPDCHLVEDHYSRVSKRMNQDTRLKEESMNILNTYAYMDLLKMIDLSSLTTFLVFHGKNINKGRVLFRLSSDVRAARHCFELCSGEIGRSYASGKKTNVVFYKPNRPTVWITDVLTINAEVTYKPQDAVDRPRYPGTLYSVCSYKHRTFGVGILTKGEVTETFMNEMMEKDAEIGFAIIGRVYKGLELLQKISNPRPVINEDSNRCLTNEDKIIDCGIVLQMS